MSGLTVFRLFRDQAAITGEDLPFDCYDAMLPVDIADSEPSDITVTATSNWVVRWTGGGTNGVIAVPTVRSATQIHVGQLESVKTVTASEGLG